MENVDILTNGAGGAEEEQRVSGEDLFQAYQDGKSFEELKEMFAARGEEPEEEAGNPSTVFDGPPPLTQGRLGEEAETADEEAEPAETTGSEELKTEEGSGKPFRVYQTREDFQKHFDHEWGKRHGETMRKMSEQERQIEETSGLLAEVLGVPKEKALEELRSRRYAMEAQQNGYENPEQYAALKKAENQIAEMRQAERQRQIDEQIADIRRQGSLLSSKVSGFDLDKAMENEAFRQTVFSLQKAGAQDSVEKAFRAVFFEEFMKQSKAPEKPVVSRPREGAAAPKTKTAVKPVNVAGMNSSDIRELEKRILRGETVTF